MIGIDLGGANLKYATLDGRAVSHRFEMWRRYRDLSVTLVEHLSAFDPTDAIAVTMTGELADCFIDRHVGVAHLVDATVRAVEEIGRRQLRDAPEVFFYGVDGRFRVPDDAKRSVNQVAAANWHALSNCVARTIAPNGILIDVGSTTTDIISLSGGIVGTRSTTDHDRLVEQSLVYIGCRRTPVCGLVRTLTFNGATSRVMNELFATIDDAMIVLGLVDEAENDCDSADGGPRTIERSVNRLARMIGLDRRSVSLETASDLAGQVLEAARNEMRLAIAAIDKVSPDGPIVLSGHGVDLIDAPHQRKTIHLADHWGVSRSRCAPAWAVAFLKANEVAESFNFGTSN